MKSVSLTAYPRSLSRRAGAKKLRSSARIPAVIYGRRTTPRNLELKLKDIQNLIHHSASENVLVDLVVSGEPDARRLALVQEVQHHGLTGQVLHVDFHEVAEDEKVTITVPLESVGEAVGVKTGGGVLEHVLFKIKVRALPKDLPETVTVDVSNLEIGQAVHLGAVPVPPGVEVLGDKNITVLAVAAPITEAQEAAAATAGPTEVEAIKEKKEEGEAPAAPAGKGAEKAEKGADKGEKAEKGAEKGSEKKAEKKK